MELTRSLQYHFPRLFILVAPVEGVDDVAVVLFASDLLLLLLKLLLFCTVESLYPITFCIWWPLV